MERLSQMSLKKSFFFLTVLFLLGALLLSIISIMGISEIIKLDGPSMELEINKDDAIGLETNIYAPGHLTLSNALSLLQFILPSLYVLLGLALSTWLFYKIKIKPSLTELQRGTEQIMQNNLDFSILSYSKDELGQLCSAFETMRFELLKDHKELWRQMEERKRLNAAFSHDLRNPITVIKGAVSLLKKGIAEEDKLNKESINSSLLLLEDYSRRIEMYIESMSNIQRLEEISCTKEPVQYMVLIQELSNALTLLCKDKKLIIEKDDVEKNRLIWIDKFIIHNLAENLVSNAVRYAKKQINIMFKCENSDFHFIIQDDGTGFSDKILYQAPEPFLHDKESTGLSENFGMGLYICRLFCEKHGGRLILKNTNIGAKVTASLNILKH